MSLDVLISMTWEMRVSWTKESGSITGDIPISLLERTVEIWPETTLERTKSLKPFQFGPFLHGALNKYPDTNSTKIAFNFALNYGSSNTYVVGERALTRIND